MELGLNLGLNLKLRTELRTELEENQDSVSSSVQPPEVQWPGTWDWSCRATTGRNTGALT